MMHSSPLHTLLYLCALPQVFGTLFDLADLQWTLKNRNGSIQIPASGPPSQAHLDLANAGIITEPLLGINDFTQRWVIDDSWTYTADITPFLNSTTPGTTLLVFYGIDTVANITLRGHPVAWVNNQFRQYTFDVSTHIASPPSIDNNLTVIFESAYHYGLNVTARPDAEHFPGNGGFEYPALFTWVRKIPSDYGWDWGPAFVPTGIHKSAYLITLSDSSSISDDTLPISEVFVDETSIDIYKEGQSFAVPPNQHADWIVNVSLALRTAAALPSSVLTFTIPELNLTSPLFSIPAIPASSADSAWIGAAWAIPEGVPQRWYPHNLGMPKLYDLEITLDVGGVRVVSFVTRTGFRTIELAQLRYPDEEVKQRGIAPGDQWHFEINGKAFYSFGSNLIPFDPFYARTTTEEVRWVLESAVKSGQNMLRVWGGGTYQPSSASVAGGGYDFYSICDELGILAWSELIFSDALYPINDFMLQSIEPEVRQNVRRINRHPSNVQWAGGNEIEGIAIWTNKWENNGKHYFDEFVTMFQDFLHDIVVSETRSVPYTDCSTTKGVLSLDPYILRFENGTSGEIYGNGERFEYDANKAFDYSTFPESRFINEFGFHSMPSFYTWEEVLTSPEDFHFNSTVVMSREHHPPPGNLTFPNPNAPQGQHEMTVAVEQWLGAPVASKYPAQSNETFSQWCWSTQIFQRMTITAQIAWYRRSAGTRAHTLGALIWQLNDIWQGVSWSSLEYSGRWKALQYGLASVFSPIAVYPFWTPLDETLRVMVLSDRWETVSAHAQLTWYDWTGRVLNTTQHEVEVPSLNASVVYEAAGLGTILPTGKKAKDVWLLLNVTAQIDDGRVVSNEEYFTPISLAGARLVDPKIRVAVGRDLTFTLSARGGVSPWTWMDHPAGTVGVFVDAKTGLPSNGFYLVPGIDRTLKFLLNSELSRVTTPNLDDFVVRSLWDNRVRSSKRRRVWAVWWSVLDWLLSFIFRQHHT